MKYSMVSLAQLLSQRFISILTFSITFQKITDGDGSILVLNSYLKDLMQAIPFRNFLNSVRKLCLLSKFQSYTANTIPTLNKKKSLKSTRLSKLL